MINVTLARSFGDSRENFTFRSNNDASVVMFHDTVGEAENFPPTVRSSVTIDIDTATLLIASLIENGYDAVPEPKINFKPSIRSL